MKFLLSLLVALSIASVADSLAFGGSSSSSSSRTSRTTTTTTTTPSTTTQLRDLVDGNLQWYADSIDRSVQWMGDDRTSRATAAVSQDAINRRLLNAAERFMKFQSGYFSPMMSNDNNVNMNNRNNNANNNGFYNNNYYDAADDTTSILAEDFIFRGPVIGPLTKYDYIEVLDYFKIYEAFPDINPNCYGFTVDVIDPLKVRFFVKGTGTYQFPLAGFLGDLAAKKTPPDGRQYMGNTEAWSITFNDLDWMQVKCISAGYIVDRFEDESLCTAGGKGLTFGILNTLGISFPTEPGSKSLQLIQWITKAGQSGNGDPGALFPKAFSDRRTIPDWWTDSRFGAK